MNLNRRAYNNSGGLGALNHSLSLVGEVLFFSTGSVENVLSALTEEVQLVIVFYFLNCSFVNTLAVHLRKGFGGAVPVEGVLALFDDTLARTEVDNAVANVVVAGLSSWLVLVPVGLFHQIPQPVDGFDLVMTVAVEFPFTETVVQFFLYPSRPCLNNIFYPHP